MGRQHRPRLGPHLGGRDGRGRRGLDGRDAHPLHSAPLRRLPEQSWGLEVSRKLFRKNERSLWQHIPRDAAGWVSFFGELHGLAGLKAPRQVELFPYTVGKLGSFPAEAGNPYATGRSRSLYGGLDGKVGVTGDLTLNFTLNPDFGQVEADPSVVNLTAFETYYEEKRPFFIEGRNILSFNLMGGDGDMSSDNLFYTRRIGRTPQYYPEVDGFVRAPEATSILGAFKLTGKTRGGWSVGLIESLTAEENAATFIDGADGRLAVEPLTNYFGLRLQKDYNQGATTIGGMVTAVNRRLDDAHLEFLHDQAYSGGFDFYHSWKKRTHYFSLKLLGSTVHGSPEALLRTQMSPLRYYQRPDAATSSSIPRGRRSRASGARSSSASRAAATSCTASGPPGARPAWSSTTWASSWARTRSCSGSGPATGSGSPSPSSAA